MSNIVKLIISIVVCQLAGVIGNIFTSESVSTWYQTLNKAPFNPPDWLFGPVWITLYLLMGISMFLVWREGLQNQRVKPAFILFIVQLVLNIAWSMVFFGMQSISGGLIVIIILWFLIILTIIRFKSISKVAAFLLVPYLLWVSFATVLTFYIYKLN